MTAIRRIFWWSLILLTIACLLRGFLEPERDRTLLVVPIFAGFGAVVGALTFLVANSPLPRALRGLFVLVLGYHACFGPIMLAYLLTTEVQRNDDLPLVLYPHIVELINSLE